jgi:hypothetical protein
MVMPSIANGANGVAVDAVLAVKRDWAERGNLGALQRYHFYPWHRRDFARARIVWDKLSVEHPAPEASDSRSGPDLVRSGKT